MRYQYQNETLTNVRYCEADDDGDLSEDNSSASILVARWRASNAPDEDSFQIFIQTVRQTIEISRKNGCSRRWEEKVSRSQPIFRMQNNTDLSNGRGNNSEWDYLLLQQNGYPCKA